MKSNATNNLEQMIDFQKEMMEGDMEAFLDHVVTLAELPCAIIGPQTRGIYSYKLNIKEALISTIKENGLPSTPVCLRNQDNSDYWGFPIKHREQTVVLLIVERPLDEEPGYPYQKICSMVALIEKFFRLKKA
jgi:hypothetical protein